MADQPMTGLTRFDGAVRLWIMFEFLEGRTPSAESVAADLEVTPAAANGSFLRLAASRAIVLAPGTHDLVMAAPFSAKPTDYRVTIGGREYFANCIWDAFGIPAMLDAVDATIETVCADCQAPLRLAVENGRPIGDPAVVHFAVPAARWWANIVFT
jgi:hypothetical protein